jgi:8-oxo-dGTP diphosphatase
MAIASVPNAFGGCVVSVDGAPADPAKFALGLAESVEAWRAQGIKVAWLTIPVERAPLIPAAVQAGFLFHHTDERALTLTLRLVDDAYIPPSATHFVGAGGVVLTAARELLVVSERHRRAGTGRHYKLPGGALHQSEHIVAAVTREIREETGIDTRFRALVCFRHWHGYRDGKSDIYFVCRLDPLSMDLQCQREELEECRWMPVDEYLDHGEVSVFNKRVVRAALSGEKLAPEQIAGYGAPETHELFMPPA